MTYQAAQPAVRERTICLVGNPNTGKSVLFGLLTGHYVTVSNYPGTTVEILRGSADLEGQRCTLVDSPGANSLIPTSEDERVTRDLLLEDPSSVVLQVGDAKNLRRVLSITVQLAEMGHPMILALNMADEARRRGIRIDANSLSVKLGIPVAKTVAVDHAGVDELIQMIPAARALAQLVTYPEPVERAISRIEDLLPTDCAARRGVAVMVLSGDESLNGWLDNATGKLTAQAILRIRDETAASMTRPLAHVIAQRRTNAVQKLAKAVLSRSSTGEGSIQTALGHLAMHPLWGIPMLAVVLLLTWLFVGLLGSGLLVNILQNTLFGRYVNPAAIRLFSHVPSALIRDLFVGQYGIITMAITYGVAIVLPVVFTFFIAFGVLEDSGYLPRLAVMVNKVFRTMGLNGKAVLPMVLGLGCDTMATLTTRILETRRERVIVTLLLALGVPCSAQLGVILSLLTSVKSLAIWAAVVLLVLIAVGYLAGRLMPGEGSDFIMEVPPVRAPKLKNIFVKTLARTEWYLREALPLFVAGTLVLFTLDKLTILGALQRLCTPVVSGFLGLPPEATRAFIMGFLRRDYAGAGLKTLYDAHMLTPDQLLVSLVTITLFVPCIANFFVIIKERGMRTAFAMTAFIMPFAVLVGGLVRVLLRWRGL